MDAGPPNTDIKGEKDKEIKGVGAERTESEVEYASEATEDLILIYPVEEKTAYLTKLNAIDKQFSHR